MPPKILIVEDTASLALMYQSYLIPTGMKTQVAATGAEALIAISEFDPDLILLDVMLPDMNGLDILSSLQGDNQPQVIVLTGHATKEMAIKAIKLGANDFLEKPIEADRFRITINNALKLKDLKQTVEKYQAKYENGRYFDLIGSSAVMQSVYQIINSAASSKATVFITGESGTGKELCAKAVHQASPRAKKPFVALNCAAIPKDLIESEIFGHLKGAFTGAIANREGAAGQADGGTLFLDELCEMDINLQSKLLRFIQTGCYQQVGSEKEVKVDVRFVCATNRDPLIEVQAGRFREDLYYRLHVIPVNLPPLRDRGVDIIEIVPSEDKLLIETKIIPKDIAFLHPGLPAVVKVTAYDFTRYGGLNGTVEHISADTSQDEEGNSFYIVKVRTEFSSLTKDDGTEMPIIPGMLTSDDVITGQRSVLEYILNPILRAKDTALRER